LLMADLKENCTFCKSLPKVELHAHLGGSIRNSTLLELLEAERFPNAHELARRCVINGVDTKRTPSEQFEMFEIIGRAWKNDEITKRVTREFIQDCVKENVVYVELRTSGSSRDKIVSILDTMDECSKEYPTIVVRLLISVKREWNLDTAQDAIKTAIDLKNRGVVGLDFCGNPTCGSFIPFKKLFLDAAKEGLKITCHFAETENEKDLADILSVKPSRLGHACYMDPTSKEAVKALNLPIEACFASNINTMKLFNGISEHPFMDWWKNGFNIIPCTDNYGILEKSLSDHYHMIHKVGATEEELWKITENSIKFIFAEEAVKQKLYGIFNEYKQKTALCNG